MAQITTEAIERDRGLPENKLKPKKRKWKIQARSGEHIVKERKGPALTKRPVSEVNWESPKVKRKKIGGLITGIHLISPRAKHILK